MTNRCWADERRSRNKIYTCQLCTPYTNRFVVFKATTLVEASVILRL